MVSVEPAGEGGARICGKGRAGQICRAVRRIRRRGKFAVSFWPAAAVLVLSAMLLDGCTAWLMVAPKLGPITHMPRGPLSLLKGLRGGGFHGTSAAFVKPGSRFAARGNFLGNSRGLAGSNRGGFKSFKASSKGREQAPTLPAGGYKLVIVESPAKARTIQKFLDMSKYVVDSCMGHVRDLPGSAKKVPAELKASFGKILGVDPDNNFNALYVTLEGTFPSMTAPP